MKQSDKVQKMKHQRRICAFLEYHRYEQEQIYGTPKMLVSMVLLKCTNSPIVIHFLNFVRLFRLQVLLIITLPVSFVIFFHLQFLMITLAKILFLLFLKLRMQTFQKNFLFPIPLQETIDIAINLIFSHNPNLNITRKEL